VSVIWTLQDAPLYGQDPGVCFFCHEALTLPAVVWSGGSGFLFLHVPCVAPLFERLAVDSYAARSVGALP